MLQHTVNCHSLYKSLFSPSFYLCPLSLSNCLFLPPSLADPVLTLNYGRRDAHKMSRTNVSGMTTSWNIFVGSKKQWPAEVQSCQIKQLLYPFVTSNSLIHTALSCAAPANTLSVISSASNNKNKSLFTEQLGWGERNDQQIECFPPRWTVPSASNRRACNLSILFDSLSHTLHPKDCKDREHRIGLSFCTLMRPLSLTSKIHTHIFFFFLIQCGCFCVCWGQGYENKSLPLSQVMCLFSSTHLLVYCVVAFLPSYRLALTGHFSPSNPVHHILVLESVKWVLEKRGHNVCLCCYWTQMGLVLFFCPGRCINGSF